jgi:hypothetical protein
MANRLAEKCFLRSIKFRGIGRPVEDPFLGPEDERFTPVLVHAQEYSPLGSDFSRPQSLGLATTSPLARSFVNLDATSPGVVGRIKNYSVHQCGSHKLIEPATLTRLTMLSALPSFFKIKLAIVCPTTAYSS